MKNTNKTTLKIGGMTCVNCSAGIKTHLEKQGFKDVEVHYSTSEVLFKANNPTDIDSAINHIKKLGYKVYNAPLDGKRKTWQMSLEQKFFVSLVFTIPLLLSMFVNYEILHNMYFQLLLTLPVYTIGFFHFGLSAYRSIRAGYTNMDVLIFTGSSAAFIYSLIGTLGDLGHNYMFYETSASIITIVLFGNLIEHRSVKKTSSAIDELLKLQPQKAKKLVSSITDDIESIEEVPVELLKDGDFILINEGDKIPVDGVIVQGKGSVDESMLSGESIPVFKKNGDTIIAGSILLQGNIKIKATQIGSNTVLSKIIELVKNAQSEKPKLQNLADKISRIFVPVVVGIALITFVISFFGLGIEHKNAIMRSIAVLVVACPCALGLAIPTAVVVGVGEMAKKGILIKGGITIELLTKSKRIVFDKTGTLTTGAFKIKQIETYEYDASIVKSLLLGMERYSSHPIAVSIVKELTAQKIKPTAFKEVEEIKGIGIKAIDDEGNLFEAGSVLLWPDYKGEKPHNIYLLKNKALIATVDIEDEIKDEAFALISFLKKTGITPVMLSGDNKENCTTVAAKLGISEVYYEKLPAQKLEIIKKFQEGEQTAMVGDGINDAPALAKAGVGISLSNATQVAVESAQVILLNGNISLLIPAIKQSKKTMTTIKQNLFWAFFYNVLAIPIAAAGYLVPMIAALAMAFSDVIVVLNSLWLKLKLKNS